MEDDDDGDKKGPDDEEEKKDDVKEENKSFSQQSLTFANDKGIERGKENCFNGPLITGQQRF